MKHHLTAQTLLDLAETGAFHPHVAECARCRLQVDAARDALARARQVDVPEPSPLFWEHLSSRVHDALQNDAEPGAKVPSSWLQRPAWLAAIAAAVVVVCVAVAWLVPAGRGPVGSTSGLRARVDAARSSSGSTPAGDLHQVEAELLEPATDPSWNVIAHVAGAVDIDTAIVVQPGDTDRAVSQLSAGEQQEFLRLLKRDLDAPPTY